MPYANATRGISLTNPAAATRISSRPMGELNTTPLIDVLLVLIVMLIITVPLATNSLDVPLPNGEGKLPVGAENTVRVDANDQLYWNGEPLDRQELLNQVAASAAMEDEPLLRFEPEPRASYDASARTIALIKDAGVTKFAFVGNHKYRKFEKAE